MLSTVSINLQKQKFIENSPNDTGCKFFCQISQFNKKVARGKAE